MRETERRLASIAGNLPGMVYRRVLHPNGSISYPYLSGGATALLGLSREELDRSLAFEDFARMIVRPDDAARWDEEIRRSAETLSPYRLEISLRRRDGATRWVQSSANPYRSADGAIVWDGVTLDVTERKRAEEALQKSEERAKRIVESVKDHAIFTLDAKGAIVDWTAGAEAVFGWTADEIVGKSFELTFTAEDRAAGVPQKELETARTEGCANDERWHLRKDGTRFFVNGSSRPLHDAQGNITGFIKIGRDETKRRATEAELARREAHLSAIFEQSAAGLSEVDASGRFVRVNDRF
jgi:PAS domain S-box-containing protein